VETAKLLAKDSKPCPKCQSLIFKISGCDQMWCTQCHTAFSWKTGSIEKTIHNPHYYEWQRKNGTVQRNPNDIECGRELDHNTPNQIKSIIENKDHTNLLKKITREQKYWCYTSNSGKTRINTVNEYTEQLENIFKIIRNNIHNIRVELNNYRTDYVVRNQELRIQYLMNEIDEEEFKLIVQRNDKKNKKNIEIDQVIQLSNTAITDIIYRVKDNLKTAKQNKYNLDTFQQELEELRKYCNDIFKDIGFTYSCVQYGFDADFHFARVEKERKPRKKQQANFTQVAADINSDNDDNSSVESKMDNIKKAASNL